MPVGGAAGEHLAGVWSHGLCQSAATAPGRCLWGCCCVGCAAHRQRKQLLAYTGEAYVCCAGHCPWGCLAEPHDARLLAAEVACCPVWALSANRYLIQTRFDRRNTKFDDVVVATACCFACMLDVLRFCVDLPEDVECVADSLACCMCGCLHAQQSIELRLITAGPYEGAAQHIISHLPAAQKEMVASAADAAIAKAEAASSTGGGAGGRRSGRKTSRHSSSVGGKGKRAWSSKRNKSEEAGTQQRCVRALCGNCREMFGSPTYGVTAACPHCGTHNRVPLPCEAPSATRGSDFDEDAALAVGGTGLMVTGLGASVLSQLVE